jgi:MFS superfamily sulfate permease-like transporter
MTTDRERTETVLRCLIGLSVWDFWRAADMLVELNSQLYEAGIELRFAEMKDPVKDKLKRFSLFERLGEDAFFPTIGSAVDAHVAR